MQVLRRTAVRLLHNVANSYSKSSALSLCHRNRVLTLHPSTRLSQQKLNFAFTWLRDNCQCNKCWDGRRRILQVNSWSPSVSIVTANTNDTSLIIEWDDGHSSQYPLNWLTKSLDVHSDQFKYPPVLWTNQPYRIQFVDAEDFLTKDDVLLKCILQLERRGLLFLNNASSDESVIDKITKRFYYPRRTHYGETFRVESKDNPSNVAYTTGDLGFHTDLPYFEDQPNIQILHCVKQTVNDGGESVFSDGFSAAEILRQENPQYFHLLSQTDTYFRDKNHDALDSFYIRNKHPVIQLTSVDQSVFRIHFSNQQRDSITDLELSSLHPYYRGLKTLNDILYRLPLLLRYKMKDGEVVIFENGRILHGRTAYTGDRLFIGAYLNWEEVLSKRRTLQQLHAID